MINAFIWFHGPETIAGIVAVLKARAVVRQFENALAPRWT
jgi:hypothetical protein